MAANDNGPKEKSMVAEPGDDLIVEGYVFRTYLTADGTLIVNADDVEKFFKNPKVTRALVLRLKEEMEKRLDART